MNGDLISRSALKKEFGYTDEWYKGRTVCAIINDAPTIDSLDLDVHIGGRCCGKRQMLLDELRPKGKWVDTGRTWEETVDGFIHYGNIYECSACKAEARGCVECTSFCGYCGADMRGDGGDV